MLKLSAFLGLILAILPEALLFFYYICFMDTFEVIGFVGTLLGIYSFVKNDTSVFSLLKKNSFVGK